MLNESCESPVSLGRATEELGKVRLEPSGPVVAGTVGTWTLTLTVGSLGIDEGGTIKIAHRFASDWQPPQFDRPAEPGYTTVRTTGTAKLTARYDRKAHIRPYMKALVLDVSQDALKPGDEVKLVFGDRSGGSIGTRAQTFQETAHEFKVFIDPTNACLARPVSISPTVQVVAGPAVKLVCLLPAQCTAGEWVDLLIRGEDEWGNPAPAAAATVRWEGEGTAEIEGLKIRLPSPAIGWIVLDSALGSFRSNPITSYPQPPRLKRYWADLHAQTGTTIGTGSDDEYFAFGRDAARLDVMSHQGNDFQISDKLWSSLNETTKRFNEDGKFVVLPGYEWSANTPCGGDHNVFYLEEGLPILRSSHWQVPDAVESPLSPASPLEDFFGKMKKNVPQNKVIVASHVGGRYADMRRPLDDTLAPLVELVSCWGIFEWMLWDSFDHGHVVGIMANSDGHKGRPGCEGPGAGEFGIGNGLTCILAESLTREAVFEALKNRRCYGTTGARIDLGFSVNGQPMGSVLEPPPVYRVEAGIATVAPLEELALYAGREPIHIFRPREFDALGGSSRIRVKWGGARSRGRSRRITWNGTVRVSGNRIKSVRMTGFDSPADGITTQTGHEIRFQSGTTGDCDFFDLELDRPDRGSLEFDTEMGRCEIDLGLPGGDEVRQPCGGLDAFMSLARYPDDAKTRHAGFSLELPRETVAGRPLFVRAVQTDGHLAWASPVYSKG